MRIGNRLLVSIGCSISVLSIGLSLFAQSDRGSITGTIGDPSGAAVPNAAVKATQTTTNFSRQVVSTETGKYVVSELPAGIYTLTVSKEGFKTYEQAGITVRVGEVASVNVTLDLGAVTQTVEVRADATMLKVENAELSTSVGNEQMESLPLTFSSWIRNPMTIFKLVPGAQVVDTNGWAMSTQNGLQSFTEEIRIDGAPVVMPSPGVFFQHTPSVDAIQEFTVLTGNFNAEYGQANGAIANFALKSGTNKLHGTAYEYLRNEAFNARNHNLAPTDPKTRQRRHDFGGAIGGPLVIPRVYNGRNKTFWFTSLENFHSTDHRVAFYSVPRAEWRNGDLSSLLQPAILGTDILGRPIQQGQIYDPATTRTVVVGGQSYVVRDPFPNNQIPLRSSVAQKILGFLPPAGIAGLDKNNLLGIAGKPSLDNRIWSLKVDHNFSDKSHFSVSFNYFWDHDINGADPFGLASAVRDQKTHSDNFRLNHDYTLSSTSLNHLTLGVVRYDNPDSPPPRNFDPQAQLGLKGTLMTGWFPRVSFGLSDIGTNQLKHNWNTVPSLTDAFTKVVRSHTVKFGVEYHKSVANVFGGNDGFGRLRFAAAQTALPYLSTNSSVYSKIGSPFASFLLGTVRSASLNSPLAVGYLSSDYAFFIQDDYKITPRFTVNYGLRYDLHRPLTEKYDRISSFVADLPNPGAGGRPGALGFLGFGAGRVGRRSWLDTDSKDFGPRVGAAFKLTNKTVLRGGFGIFYGRVEANTFDPIQSTGSGSVTTSYPSIDPATQFLFSLDNGFPAVSAQPPVFDPTLLNNQGINVFSRESGQLPRIYNWNFTVQREITPNFIVEVAYVGNHGTRLIAGFLKELNQNDYSVLSMGSKLLQQINSAADAAALGVQYPYPGFTGTVAQALRPFPQYRDISDPQATVGESDYNALQVKAQKRMSRGLDFLVTYTLSKNITTVDDAFGWGGFGIIGAVNAKKLSLERGLAVDATFTNFRGDRTHNFLASFAYDLPFGNHVQERVLKSVVGGWRVSGVVQYISGDALPLSPYFPNNLANVIFNNEGRYDRVSGVPIRNNVSNPLPGVSFMFNPAAFLDPAPFTLGNAARTYGALRGFPDYDEDLSITKRFRVSESKQFEFRADIFNLFNRSVFNDPSTAVYDTPRIQGGRAVGYGTFFGVRNLERQMQMSLRFIF